MTEDGDTQNPPSKMEDKIVIPEQMDQKKNHLVLVRIGKSCLISSVVLFVSLIIVAAVAWPDAPDASSLVIGFVISLTLFMVGCSIYGVYGSKSEGLVNAGYFQVLKIRHWKI
jgi:hypothetical protein